MTPSTKFTTDLVDISKANPTIALDIRYATSNNFTQTILYSHAVCFVHKDLVNPLNSIQQELNQSGLGLKIYDGYRPLSVQKKFWNILPDERYVANPEKKPRHCRGTAIDVTLINSDGQELPMPTLFDEFTEQAHSDYPHLPLEIKKNRELLHKIMDTHGFDALPTEWWHFDWRSFENYPIIDCTLEELLQMNSYR